MRIPILPLKNVVFFPKSKIPIRIDKPNNMIMVKNCIDNSSPIGLSLAKEIKQFENEENIGYHKIITVGKIIDFESNPNGGFNILIEGTERARVLTGIENQPFQTVLVTPMADFIDTSKRAELANAAKEMLRLAEKFTEVLPQYTTILKKIIAAHPHPGIIADQIAYTFVVDSYDKQCILAENNVLKRAKMVSVQLRILIKQFSREKNKDIII